MSAVLHYTAQLETQTCGECGIEFAAPSWFWKERRENKKGWYCPNGHSRVYRETDSEKVRREMQAQVDAQKRRVEFLKREVEMEREAAATTRKILTKTCSALTKTKNRIANGVCPICRRSFKGMHEHMAKQHPEYTTGETS